MKFTAEQLIEALKKCHPKAVVHLEGCDCNDVWGGIISGDKEDIYLCRDDRSDMIPKSEIIVNIRE